MPDNIVCETNVRRKYGFLFIPHKELLFSFHRNRHHVEKMMVEKHYLVVAR